MRKRHAFRPAAPDSLEGRVLLHGGVTHVSTAGDVFLPLMGQGIPTAAQVFRARLSREEVGRIIANQFQDAFAAFETGLNEAMAGLATSLDDEAFDADVKALSEGLAARCTELLSTSPRAANSLIPFCQEVINGTDPDSLSSRLTALELDSADPSDALDVVDDSFRITLAALNRFAGSTVSGPSGGNGGGGGVDPTPEPVDPTPVDPTPTDPNRPRPAAPTRLNGVVVSPTRIDLSWTGSTGATGYKLERSTNGTDFVPAGTTAAGTTAFSDTGLTPGTTYTYRVAATSANGDSAFSATIARATLPAVPPDVPDTVLLAPLVAGHEGLSMHIHPTVRVFIDGQEQVVPPDTNITAQGMFPMHTHAGDPPGKIHIEVSERSETPGPDAYTFRIQDFFDLWRFTTGDPTRVFNSQSFLGRPIDANHRVTVTVDGQPSAELENTIVNNTDGTLFGDAGARNIVIRYETLPGAFSPPWCPGSGAACAGGCACGGRRRSACRCAWSRRCRWPDWRGRGRPR